MVPPEVVPQRCRGLNTKDTMTALALDQVRRMQSSGGPILAAHDEAQVGGYRERGHQGKESGPRTRGVGRGLVQSREPQRV